VDSSEEKMLPQIKHAALTVDGRHITFVPTNTDLPPLVLTLTSPSDAIYRMSVPGQWEYIAQIKGNYLRLIKYNSEFATMRYFTLKEERLFHPNQFQNGMYYECPPEINWDISFVTVHPYNR
jgi:hypothetical protein